MMLSSKLLRLIECFAEKEFWVGSIFRLYDVQRLDAKDKLDDYYDLMLVDLNMYKKDTFALVNVTMNNDNRGKIFAEITGVYTRFFIQSKLLQNYFDDEMQIYYVEKWDSIMLHKFD